MNKSQYEKRELAKIQELNDKYLEVADGTVMRSYDVTARMHRFNQELNDFHRQSVFDAIEDGEVNLWATRFKMAKAAYKWAKNCADVCGEMDRVWHAKEKARRWEKAMNAIQRTYTIVKSMNAFKKKLIEPDEKKLSEIIRIMTADQLNQMIASCESH
jgi:hypothetical protein